jgi:kynurenine formamidase
MRLIDLTLPIEPQQNGQPTASLDKWPITRGQWRYVANVYHFRHDSMAGTYLDFPGHIEHTDDGAEAADFPLEKLFRVPATVIRLDRASGSGKIGAEELAGACPGAFAGEAVILNALGPRRFDQVAFRSVYLGTEAAKWLIDGGVRLVISDVYESDEEPQGVFQAFFAAGVLTVCQPINLDKLTAPKVKLSVLPLRFAGVTQLPCRVVAEIEDIGGRA